MTRILSDGITEDITNSLGRFSNLLVAAKSASFQFKDRMVSPEEAGRVLGVRYLVEGSVRRAGDELRINVELTEAATGFHLWSDTYNSQLKDIFSVQDEITRKVVGATAVRLTRAERDRAMRKPTANLTAYEHMLRGRMGMTNRTPETNAEARQNLERAVQLDPNFAEAHAALGWTRYEAVVSGWSEFQDDELRQAQSLAEQALMLDPVSTSALRLLANVDVFRGDYDRAMTRIDQALALNPSDAENFVTRGYIMLFSGKPAEALPWLEGALRLDGLNGRAAVNCGIANFFLGRNSESVAILDRGLSLRVTRVLQIAARAVSAAAFAKLDKHPEAERERALTMRLSPFFDAERFAAQFGTKQTRDEMLAGLKAAGFR